MAGSLTDVRGLRVGYWSDERAATGCTVGKLHGMARATKAGLGTDGLAAPHGLRIAVIAAVNAFGDVVDPSTGEIVAGLRHAEGSSRFADTAAGTIRPVHTAYDRDTIFVAATGEVAADPLRLQSLAVDLTAAAVLRGARTATALGGIPAARDLAKG